jgi:hypothetical protein
VKNEIGVKALKWKALMGAGFSGISFHLFQKWLSIFFPTLQVRIEAIQGGYENKKAL